MNSYEISYFPMPEVFQHFVRKTLKSQQPMVAILSIINLNLKKVNRREVMTTMYFKIAKIIEFIRRVWKENMDGLIDET